MAGPAGAATKIKLACVGNSITEGTSNYPTHLQQLLGAGYQVENDGVGGTTMLKKGDKPYWTQGRLRQALAFNPNIVTIKLGTNDTKSQNWDTYGSEFKKDYIAMIDTFKTLATKPEIFLVLPVPVFRTNFGIRDSIVKKIIPIIKEIGIERNCTVIDANTPLLGFSQYFPDGVHPNAAGSDTIAHVIYRALMARTSVHPQGVPQTSMHASDRNVTAPSATLVPFSTAIHESQGIQFDPAGRIFGKSSRLSATQPRITVMPADHR
jgi:lysophospholipase L1-like esterase